MLLSTQRVHFLPMLSSDVDVKSVLCFHLLWTVTAGVAEGARKVRRLHMTQHIAFLGVALSTYSTNPAGHTIFPFDDVRVQGSNIVACNSL